MICGDAFDWCAEHANWGPVITSPPDSAELGISLTEWMLWFQRAVGWCLVASGPYPAIFYLTDRRAHGRLYSKASIVYDMANRYQRQPMWHKVALRRPVGRTDLHRPTYSHVVCVGGAATSPGRATPDVFDRGRVLYPNGMGIDAARMAVAYAKAQGHTRVANPFCGRGTVLAAANEIDMFAVGIDNDKMQCKLSEDAWLP